MSSSPTRVSGVFRWANYRRQPKSWGEYTTPYPMAYGDSGAMQLGYFPPPTSGPQQVMSVTALLDQDLPEVQLSGEKSKEVYELILRRFHVDTHAPLERRQAQLFETNPDDDDGHLLSCKMMREYIGSYWLHFSDQVPILHKPSFSPDKTPSILLIAMMAIGAVCRDKAHGATEKVGQLSNFLVWHLRWIIFMDEAFRPPAKLWVFQTLLLLELYEKMYATRELHERAHIHHATTIQLMRRGRALIGRGNADMAPPNLKEDKAPNGSRHSSTSVANTPDEWWNQWISNEATKRVAFAAFVIDSIHATMFGHSTVMVAHEMRLPLPCDDALWKAPSGADVGRMESNALASGIKPISFLEGLKRTLSGHSVKTNSFGRTILMAGLLSVSWHMNQRDLQINSLGGGQTLGGKDRWRATLTRAFDTWKNEFDKSLRGEHPYSDPYGYDHKVHDVNVVFESRTVLHHLAHMAMHVDIVDCQIFARAKRLLGRAIGPQDLSSAQRRMKDHWAPSAKARDATYYALRFLRSVLLHDDHGSGGAAGGSAVNAPLSGTSAGQAAAAAAAAANAVVASPQSGGGSYHDSDEPYPARDDVLLNRPWVLYFAALVVWCYGFALEGPCPDDPQPTAGDRVARMRDYLRNYSGVSSPEELKSMKGMNRNSGLLAVLADAFDHTQWQLLKEGAKLLNNCIQLNSGHHL